MKLVRTTSAKHDRGEIVTYVWFDHPDAARRVRDRIQKTRRYLASQPYMGKPGQLTDTREAYRVSDGTVFILRVVHTSRQWPPSEAAPDDAAS